MDHLMDLSDDDWFALVEEFEIMRSDASPSLQRVLRELVKPGVQQINKRRWSRELRKQLEA